MEIAGESQGEVVVSQRLVRVIKTPRGEAPEQVRRQWVGVVFPADGPSPLWEGGVLTEAPDPSREGYKVDAKTAIEALDSNSPAAADWFRDNLRFPSPDLTFGVDEVEEVHNEE